ncbi:MAG: hemolysin family protein [Planctomycetota bacterium]|nr:hemolysin family protein [Planctomycetota bacterium]
MWIEYLPWLIAMVVLIFCSAFFSSSEAALFFLSRRDREQLAAGSHAQRLAAKLLGDSDRLLTAILFWNLLINIVYFAIASMTSLQLQREGFAQVAGLFAIGSLLILIFFSEMLPKTVGVLRSKFLAAWVSVPLAGLVRAIDPIMPALRFANDASRRVIWPRFKPEAYLEVADLERAVEVSTTDAALLQQEKTVLQNIVTLSTIRVDELMRPRMQFLSFRPPVSINDLEGRTLRSGYVLVTEEGSEEIAAAVPLSSVSKLPSENLELHAEKVFYVPWSTTVSDALEQMRDQQRKVAAVINEFGETIGILTLEDIIDTIFAYDASRSERLLNQEPIQIAAPGRWHITGMTTIRRLGRYFGVDLPVSRSITVTGIVVESLGRLPRPGDTSHWGPFEFKVIDVPDRGQMTIELTFADRRGGRR